MTVHEEDDDEHDVRDNPTLAVINISLIPLLILILSFQNRMCCSFSCINSWLSFIVMLHRQLSVDADVLSPFISHCQSLLHLMCHSFLLSCKVRLSRWCDSRKARWHFLYDLRWDGEDILYSGFLIPFWSCDESVTDNQLLTTVCSANKQKPSSYLVRLDSGPSIVKTTIDVATSFRSLPARYVSRSYVSMDLSDEKETMVLFF
jgi:hypothetical protein